jgi:hypothetical protein
VPRYLISLTSVAALDEFFDETAHSGPPEVSSDEVVGLGLSEMTSGGGIMAGLDDGEAFLRFGDKALVWLLLSLGGGGVINDVVGVGVCVGVGVGVGVVVESVDEVGRG